MSPCARNNPWVFAILAALTLTACGPTEPTALAPEAVGRYSGTWTRSGTRDGQAMAPTVCPATLTIVAQEGTRFRGDIEVSAPCARAAAIEGGTLSGAALTFGLASDPGFGADSSTPCGSTTLPAFRGTLAAGSISATRTEAVDCRATNGHEYEMTITLSLARS